MINTVLPFDQHELRSPHDVGCTYFGRNEGQMLLILNQPIDLESANAFDYYIEEALYLSEGDDVDSKKAIARLRRCQKKIKTLKLVAVCRETYEEYVCQTDMYVDSEGWIWVDGHGDDTDSSVYIPRFAPNINAVRNLWFAYCSSDTLQKQLFHTLIFEASSRLEDENRVLENIQDPLLRYVQYESEEHAMLEHWASIVSMLQINITTVGLSQICCGAHPISGKGPSFVHPGPVVDSDEELE